MTIDNLKCFIQVAENLSFARAAEALYISQPAVTKQINSLEQELGAALLIRTTRHVELTPAGMSFYKDAKDIVLKSQLAIARVHKHNSADSSIRIGLSNHVALFYLAPLLSGFHEKYPEIRPIVECPGYKIAANLFLEKKLDVLFYYKENLRKNTGVSFLELTKDHLSCVMPAGHPLAAKDSVSLSDLNDIPVIACNPLNAPLFISDFQQQLEESHPADKLLYCDCIEIAHCMVAAGLGIAILPGVLSLRSPDFARIPLEGTEPVSFGLFYHKKTSNSALEKFISMF
ncbi:MAG: LysR family transcriptional regulator [Eubacteriales bacterium]|nr:LysR family transcriptional regulator [Eubacteriales bacterium]